MESNPSVAWKSITLYKSRIFALTFLSYAIYTAARQSLPISKSSLRPDAGSDPTGTLGWAPFSGDDGSLLLGVLDTCFLVSYAIGLFISGPLGDRLNLRFFLGGGMVASGAFCALFGLGYLLSIHNMFYYVACQIGAGLAQSTGWPGNMTLITRWFGKGSRGTIMGIWNAHSSVGNIVGKLLATSAIDQWGWQWGFVLPGLVCAGVGVVMLLFVIPHPSDVLPSHSIALMHSAASADPSEPEKKNHDDYPSIPFLQALLVPGVIEYSICLFFSKLVAYAFIGWLPYYITSLGYSDTESGHLSISYDVGGVLGGIIAGYLSDRWQRRGIVSFGMLLLCIPSLFIYSNLASFGIVANILFMAVVGIFVNGPYTLISSAVAADLGSDPSLKGNPKAMSTVTGIIDGTGSLGSSVQGVLIGWISGQLGWSAVFYMLMLMCVLSASMLCRIVYREMRHTCCFGGASGAHMRLAGDEHEQEHPHLQHIQHHVEDEHEHEQQQQQQHDHEHALAHDRVDDSPLGTRTGDIHLDMESGSSPDDTSSLMGRHRLVPISGSAGGIDASSATLPPATTR